MVGEGGTDFLEALGEFRGEERASVVWLREAAAFDDDEEEGCGGTYVVRVCYVEGGELIGQWSVCSRR